MKEQRKITADIFPFVYDEAEMGPECLVKLFAAFCVTDKLTPLSQSGFCFEVVFI